MRCSSPSPYGRANDRPTSPGPAERASARAGRRVLATTPLCAGGALPAARPAAGDMTDASASGRHQRRRDNRRWRADPERVHHRRRAGEPADDHDERQGREVGRRENRPIDERSRSLQRSEPGIVASTPTLSCGTGAARSRGRTCSPCSRLCAAGTELELAAALRVALPRRQSWVVQVAQTVRLLQPHLERRDERAHELELPDRADVLAEAGAAEAACRRRRRRRSSATTIQAVQSGLSHRANAS